MNWLSAETEEEPAGRGGKGLPRASSLGSGRPGTHSREDAGFLGHLRVNPSSSATAAWPRAHHLTSLPGPSPLVGEELF